MTLNELIVHIKDAFTILGWQYQIKHEKNVIQIGDFFIRKFTSQGAFHFYNKEDRLLFFKVEAKYFIYEMCALISKIHIAKTLGVI